jgi:uncharacterized damage-inducible protein DinB
VDINMYIRRQFEQVRIHVDAAMQDMTDDLFNWIPPGTLNPISATFLHLTTAEDDFIQLTIQRKEPIWEEQEWSVKTGVITPPGPRRGWNEFKGARVSYLPLMDYQKEVRSSTDAYIARLTDEELERHVNMFGNETSIANVLTTMVAHSSCHAGEISAIKGMYGVMGFPY